VVVQPASPKRPGPHSAEHAWRVRSRRRVLAVGVPLSPRRWQFRVRAGSRIPAAGRFGPGCAAGGVDDRRGTDEGDWFGLPYDAHAVLAPCRHHEKNPALRSSAKVEEALLSFYNLHSEVHRIVEDDLFRFVRLDVVAGNMAGIRVVRVEIHVLANQCTSCVGTAIRLSHTPPPRSGWLDELGRPKGGWTKGLGVARCAPYCSLQNLPSAPSATSCSRMDWRICSSSNPTVDTA
jgi:hypothetical protein